MNQTWLDRLLREGLLRADQHQLLTDYEQKKPFRIGSELKTWLWLGVLALSAGLGQLLYQHLDTLGHGTVLGVVAALAIGCFYYASRKLPAFSAQATPDAPPVARYALLLGCLLLLTLEAYGQWQYGWFGDYYDGLALFNAALFFFLAYRYDHAGVLAMALAAVVTWVGISASPTNPFNDAFGSPGLRYATLCLGNVLVFLATYLAGRKIKRHFTFTYFNFAANLIFVASVAGLASRDEHTFFYAALLAMFVAMFIFYARRTHSFWFLLLAVVYGYAGLTTLVFRFGGWDSLEAILLYFILSGGAVIALLLRLRHTVSKPVE